MTKPKRYKRYSAEFKREAPLRASEDGMTDKAVCDELGISTRQFRRWRDELELLGREAFPGKGRTRDRELAALKQERVSRVRYRTRDAARADLFDYIEVFYNLKCRHGYLRKVSPADSEAQSAGSFGTVH